MSVAAHATDNRGVEVWIKLSHWSHGQKFKFSKKIHLGLWAALGRPHLTTLHVNHHKTVFDVQ